MASSLEARAERAAAMERACDPRDEMLAGGYSIGSPATIDVYQPREAAPALADTLRAQLKPWSQEELDAALEPWPHAFQERHTGLFPAGEVSILAAAGREGKTTVKIGIAVAMVMQHTLAGGLISQPDRSVVVYSAEDDRAQYARKVAAQLACLGAQDASCVRERLLVPNLDDPGLASAKTLVRVLDGQPLPTGTVEAIIEGLHPLTESATPLGLLIFETASTLSDAEESNPGFRVLVLALKRIARELKVPVVLSHHVSQASLANLSDLNVSTTDIRGGTALVNNARQTGLLVNLGSDEDPFPEGDARTVLREMAAPGRPERITALISLDSSKGITPPPIFFRWVTTDWGPAAVEINAPAGIAERSWRKVLEMVRARRAGIRSEVKDEAKRAAADACLQEVVQIVHDLQVQGELPTCRKVSTGAGKGADWAKPHLSQAVKSGRLVMSFEKVPRTQGQTAVYRVPHLSGAGQ
ncbi:AAA family ATPase [Luteimonas fraxinea]|uniref:AAA family ATPase n=1 Tax=Luteimonas fraxinea TaxID=2901869 RepID=UPI001E47D283|nr:AAA family ATPase [Luteimonas fraxinea]MCD9126679.1 AAA family ATPase [Luteimonas fraxinea]